MAVMAVVLSSNTRALLNLSLEPLQVYASIGPRIRAFRVGI